MFSRKFLLIVMMLFGVLATSAQTKKLTGKVTGVDNSPLPGVTIQVAGTKVATVTSGEGTFTLNIPAGTKAVLQLSSIGYEPLQYTATADNVTIVLKEAVKSLSDVVVVGYGTAKRKDLTGSISSVPIANTEKSPVFGTSQLLQGQVSGVQVTQTNAQPGASFSVRVRGTNSITAGSDPLYVIDGYAGADITTINPSDIATMDVLKDVSATAIYGSRGANGVVIITTKQGSAGRNTVSVDFYRGMQEVSRMLKMMDATQFGNYLNTVQAYQGKAPVYTQAGLDTLGKGTNWLDEIIRTAPVTNANVSLSGGSEGTKYFLGASYFDQQGIIINSGYKRGTVRFNLTRDISKKVRLGINSSISYNTQGLAAINSNGGSTGGTLLDAMRISPVGPVYNPDGSYTFVGANADLLSQIGNPVANAMLNTDKQKEMRTFANMFGEWEIIKGLKLRSTLGGEYRTAREDIFHPTTTYWGAQDKGLASIESRVAYNYLTEHTLTYDKAINKNNAITALVGYTYQLWRTEGSTNTINNLTTNKYGTTNMSVGTAVPVRVQPTEYAIQSYLGRINYRLMDKYLFTVSMRADGTSKFGPNKKWGYYPSGAFAWRVSDEEFLKNVKQISDLKARISYGTVGNQSIDPYLSLQQYTTNSYILSQGRVVGTSPNNFPNPDLGWESTSSFDFGFDLGLWNNRLTVTADYYNKQTSDLLFSRTIPSTSGFTTVMANIGKVENVGYELGLSSVNVETGQWNWTTSFNIATNRNKIKSLGGQDNIPQGNVSSSVFPGGQNSGILKVGESIGSFYGYQFGGIWQSDDQIKASGTKQTVKPGDPIYVDQNGDGVLSADKDRVIIGHALPKFTYGFTSNLKYGPWALSIFLQGVQGQDILNVSRIEMENGAVYSNKFAYVATDSWHGEGTSNTLPAIGSGLRRASNVTSDIVEDGSFLRIKTVTLSYQLPLPKITKDVFKSALIYATVQNLYTFTNYSGFDPEVNTYANSFGNYTSLNIDYNPYPNIRTYTVGVKFGF
ncbi:TonB-linked outer membrane protein, SusC/RagA family [Chitinophaga jiangningensis]|uniref:TonB-linked outer membrane protein, SusC/RagA family n=1 Tax=Chitinophaga jiangningensis TaxID=1419482 RepID=A0A1M6VRB2_9BACT|nr:TonB-dependent receptor [Chitinophaga jiangningensis]SHK84097.1 TonB-linked outer membrane protein, SusC/RagA family [Chitinophaga jiangningensis]